MAVTASVLALGSASRAWADGLTITAVYDSTITANAHAAAIESAINSAIGFYESTFSNPINVAITFSNMGSGLGQSASYFSSVQYSSYVSALTSTASGDATDTTALAHIPVQTNNPITHDANIDVKSANLAAVGMIGPNVNGGTISLNSGATTAGGCASNCYNLETVAEHEIDEVLGLGSDAFNKANGYSGIYLDPMAEDLFRYNSSGALSYYANGGPANTGAAYFSLNGTTHLAQFNNSSSQLNNDAGDWASGPLPTGNFPQVQDAVGSPGSSPLLNGNSPEVVALDAMGYNLVGTEQVTPEPASLVLLATGALCMLGLAWRQRRAATVGSNS